MCVNASGDWRESKYPGYDQAMPTFMAPSVNAGLHQADPNPNYTWYSLESLPAHDIRLDGVHYLHSAFRSPCHLMDELGYRSERAIPRCRSLPCSTAPESVAGRYCCAQSRAKLFPRALRELLQYGSIRRSRRGKLRKYGSRQLKRTWILGMGSDPLPAIPAH